VAAAAAELHPDIMRRRCPKMRNLASPIVHYGTSLTGRRRQQPYALKARDDRRLAAVVSTKGQDSGSTLWRYVCCLISAHVAFSHNGAPSSADTEMKSGPQRNVALAAQASQLPAALQAELDAFGRWCTTRFYGQQQEPIAEVTAAKYLDHLRRALPHCETICGGML